MPSSAAVTGRFLDTDGNPVEGGKVVATLVGEDSWPGSAQVVTRTEDATTGPDGAWTLDLLVNGEGSFATTTWTITGYGPDVKQVFEYRNIFIPVAVPAALTALNETSANNIKAAKDNSMVRQIATPNYAAYLALPANQRRANDHVLIVPGV